MRRLGLLLAALAAFACGLAAPAFAQAPGRGAQAMLRAPAEAAPVQDRFLGASAAITGTATRKTETGGLTWLANPGSSSPTLTNPISVNGTGEANGSNGGNSAHAMAYLDPGWWPNRWVEIRWSPYYNSSGAVTPGTYVEENATFTGSVGSDSWSKTQVVFSTGVPGLITIRGNAQTGVALNSSATQKEAISNVLFQIGDGLRYRQYTDAAGHVLNDYYLNDHLMGHGAHDFAADSVPLNGTMGLAGNLQGSNRPIDSVSIGDPGRHCMVTLDRPGRTDQVNADGSLDLPMRGEFTCQAPIGLTATVSTVGVSALAPITGFVRAPIAGLRFTSCTNGAACGAGVGAAGVWRGIIHIPAASAPAVGTSLQIEIQRSLVTGETVYAWSGVEKVGEVTLTNGQSLMQLAWSNGASTTACGFYRQGSIDNVSGVLINRRTLAGGTGDAPALINNVFNVASSVTCGALTFVEGGKGGSYLVDPVSPANGREVGTTNNDALMDGLAGSNGNALVLLDNSFHYEASNQCSCEGTNFNVGGSLYVADKAAMNKIVDNIELAVGHAIKVVLHPLGAFDNTGDTASDVRAQAARRLVWELNQENPTRYDIGPEGYDLQHTSCGSTCDFYHYSGAGFDEMNRRYGLSWAHARGYDSTGHMGPNMVSVSRPDGTHVAITFANVMDGIGFGGAAGSGGDSNRASLSFDFTDGTFAHLVSPSGQCVVSSTTVITCPFSGGQPAGTVWVRGPYGENPANRANDATINVSSPSTAAVMSLGSWICATRTAETCIPLHAFFSNSGGGGSAQDWLSGWIFVTPLIRRRKNANDNAAQPQKRAA